MLVKKMRSRLSVLMFLCVVATMANAHQALDVSSWQAVNQSEMFKNTNELTQIALSKHLGSQVREGSELKQVYGRYIYRVALLDSKRVKWNVDLDAKTGEIISNMID